MSLLHSDAFLAHLSQSKSEAKQQVNSMIDAIYAKVLLDLELWLNKDKDRNDSVHGLGLNHNDATDEQMQSMSTNTQQMHENVNCPSSLHPSHLQSHSNPFQIKTEDDEVDSKVIQYDSNEKSFHLDFISNSKQSSQSQPMTIKEEVEPMQTHQVQSSSYAPISNEQFNHNLTVQHSNNKDECENSQINMPDMEMQPQPQQLAHIKHNQFDDEECDCDECVDGGNEVKVEDDEDDQVDDESSRLVKRTRMDSTQQNDAIGEESIATECTTNPIQPNLAKSNRHFQCSHCQKSFVYNSHLQQHLRVHTGERPFECEQCDKRFSQSSNLTQHKLIHQNIKRFRCDQCGKQFALKHRLDSHLRTHSGDRPFECRHCENSFTTSDHRNKHEQAIHLHVKPYRCKQCGHTATQHSTIIQHIRVVHFGLPKSIKQQRARNIIDERDPRELVEKVTT